MQVNAAFLLVEKLQNSRQFDATCDTDNQSITKSYENSVAFFKLIILRISEKSSIFAVEYVRRLFNQRKTSV